MRKTTKEEVEQFISDLEEDILSDRNFNIERICPDCECDMAESESLKWEYM